MAKHDAAPEDELSESGTVVESDTVAESATASVDEKAAGDADEADYDAEASGSRWLTPARAAIRAISAWCRSMG